ncbi:hypothetical protein ACQP3F_32635, partial [Escherichia coli]
GISVKLSSAWSTQPFLEHLVKHSENHPPKMKRETVQLIAIIKLNNVRQTKQYRGLALYKTTIKY